jgi:CO/xanthine dehydrogenase Mo-binding subunit
MRTRPRCTYNVRAMIGTARRRRDGEAKVRGATRYVGDMPVFGLLHARPVLAAEAHARITSIDTAGAAELPGVVAVLTAADLPIQGGSGRAAEPLAREEIVWSGQPVALVVAETEAAAEDAAALVFVDAEPLPAVMDIEQALAPDAPPVRLTEGPTDDDDASAAHGGGPAGDASANGDGPNATG